MPHPVLSYLNSYGRGRDGISEAEPNLRVVSAGLLSLLAVLWLKDGLLLFLGRVRRPCIGSTRTTPVARTWRADAWLASCVHALAAQRSRWHRATFHVPAPLLELVSRGRVHASSTRLNCPHALAQVDLGGERIEIVEDDETAATVDGEAGGGGRGGGGASLISACQVPSAVCHVHPPVRRWRRRSSARAGWADARRRRQRGGADPAAR